MRPVGVILGLALVAGCTSGNGANTPGFTSVNLNANKLQLAVGVATFQDGSQGLNVVTTLRQANGLSGTLLSTPTLTGPFTVPTGSIGTRSGASTVAPFLAECSPNVDAGTGHITGSAQSVVTANATCTTFGQAGGVFGYGFAPENSTTAQAPDFFLYGDLIDATTGGEAGGPFYGTDGMIDDGFTAYRGGPPAYPNARLGTYPTGFLGYTLGYTTFAMPPVAGTYNLSVNIPSGNTKGATLTAPAATLASTTGLAQPGTPTFVEDGNGGGTASCTASAGSTETLIELADVTFSPETGAFAGAFYTQVVAGTGTVSYTFSPSLGPSTNGKPGTTIVAGDPYEVSCISADYPLYEAGPPQNTSQTPTLVGAAGQADIAFSVPFYSSGYGTEDDAHSVKPGALHTHARTR